MVLSGSIPQCCHHRWKLMDGRDPGHLATDKSELYENSMSTSAAAKRYSNLDESSFSDTPAGSRIPPFRTKDCEEVAGRRN